MELIRTINVFISNHVYIRLECSHVHHIMFSYHFLLLLVNKQLTGGIQH